MTNKKPLSPKDGFRRRDFLKAGAVTVGVPLVLTLGPKAARAQGSWQSSNHALPGSGLPGHGYGGGGTGGGGGGGGRSSSANDTNDSNGSSGGFAMPGSFDWRNSARMTRREGATQSFDSPQTFGNNPSSRGFRRPE